MREQIKARLNELKGEFEVGQTRLREAELEATRLRETLLRINGAILVLEELLSKDTTAEGPTSADLVHADGVSR
jgi:hypothetical protein